MSKVPPIPPTPRHNRQYTVGEFPVSRLKWGDGENKFASPQVVETSIPAEIYGPFAIFWRPDGDSPKFAIGHVPTGLWVAYPQGRRLSDKRENAELVIDSLEALGLARWEFADSHSPEARALIAEWYPHLQELRKNHICS